MANYLGEFPVDVSKHPVFKDYTPADWAMHFIGRYGQIDGSHHKTWVLDQVARILKGTPVEVVEARWENGQTEYRVSVSELPSQGYLDWIRAMTTGENEGYGYEEGIAP